MGTLFFSLSVCFGLLGLIFNVIRLVLINRKANNQRGVFDLTVISISVAHIISALVFSADGLYGLLQTSKTSINVGLIIIKFAIYFSVSSSFTHTVFIASQRVIAVLLPLKYKILLSVYRSGMALAITWLASAALAVLLCFEKIPILILSSIALACGVAMIFLYATICYKIVRQQKCFSSTPTPRRKPSFLNTPNNIIILHSVFITLAFIICVYPKAIVSLLHSPPHIADHICDHLIELNPFLDAFVYILIYYCKQRRSRLMNVQAIQIQERVSWKRPERRRTEQT